MPHIEIERVSKRYGTVVGVEDMSLSVDRGEILGLTGASGSGKTTLLRLITGLETPDTGRISINGTLMSRPGWVYPPWRRGVGMVFQGLALWPHLTVFQNVEFGLAARKINRQERCKRVERALRQMKIERYARRFPHQLSGGERQRVALARALVLEPEILLLDEPLTFLDKKLKAELRQEIYSMVSEKGITTIFVSHDEEDIEGITERIVCLHAGKIGEIRRTNPLR